MYVQPLRPISKGTPRRKASFCQPRSGWYERALDPAGLCRLTTRITGSVYVAYTGRLNSGC